MAWARWVAACTLALAFLAAPGRAFALQAWTEGVGEQGFSEVAKSGTVVGSVRGAPGVALERKLLWQYRRPGEEPFEPFSAKWLPNGNVLIASRSNEVLEVARDKRIVWSYTRLRDDARLVNVYHAQRLANGNTLIVDRRADFVIEVTPDKRTVWQYGATRDSLAPGSLFDPFSAQRLANGNTLIVDNRGGNRVIEVRSTDYDPAQPSLGYTADSIVWQYGIDGSGGIGPGQLASPRNAQGLSNGNVLITDSSDQVTKGERIIEVDRTGDVVWQWGVPGESGTDTTHLYRPSAAQRLDNGNTVIVEEDGRRMLEVTGSGALADVLGPSEPSLGGETLGKQRSVDRTSKGTTILSDQENQRVVEVGYVASGTFTSEKLWLGLPGVTKRIARIEVTGDSPPGTTVTCDYSLDGRSWVRGGRSVVDLPAKTKARQVQYRLNLKSPTAASTPVVREVRILFDVAPTDPGDPDPAPTSGGSESEDTRRSTKKKAKPRTRTGVEHEPSAHTAAPPSVTNSAASGAAGGAVAVATAAEDSLTRGMLLETVTQSAGSPGPASASGAAGSRGSGRGLALALISTMYLGGAAAGAKVGVGTVAAELAAKHQRG